MSRDTAPPRARRLFRDAAVITGLSWLTMFLYYRLLVATPFPPDYVRLVPFIALAGATAGVWLALNALAAGTRAIAAAAVVGAATVNIGIGAIFAFAAIMGD